MTECVCVSSCLVTLTTVPCDIRMSSVPRFLTDRELRMFRRFTGLLLFSADLTVACFEVSKQTRLLYTPSDTCMTPSKYELLLLLLLKCCAGTLYTHPFRSYAWLHTCCYY